ncbi:hypothetical protein ACP70R_039032 [Stipagrostis hirtigluma subsp. patula]
MSETRAMGADESAAAAAVAMELEALCNATTALGTPVVASLRHCHGSAQRIGRVASPVANLVSKLHDTHEIFQMRPSP